MHTHTHTHTHTQTHTDIHTQTYIHTHVYWQTGSSKAISGSLRHRRRQDRHGRDRLISKISDKTDMDGID